MSLFLPPAAPQVPEWVRKAATAVNQLLRNAVQKDGTDIYVAPVADAAYDQTQIQALMDAVSAISDRLK